MCESLLVESFRTSKSKSDRSSGGTRKASNSKPIQYLDGKFNIWFHWDRGSWKIFCFSPPSKCSKLSFFYQVFTGWWTGKVTRFFAIASNYGERCAQSNNPVARRPYQIGRWIRKVTSGGWTGSLCGFDSGVGRYLNLTCWYSRLILLSL